MKIVCNGKDYEIATGQTLSAFIVDLGLNVDTVVAECDGKILRREEYDSHELQHGSRVELIRFVGGG